MLRRKEFASRFPRVGRVVGDKKLVGVAKQINLAAFKVSKIQTSHTFENRCQTSVFVLHRVTKAVAGGVKISKQAFDINFRRIAAGRSFNGAKDGRQIRVQAFVSVGILDDIGKQLAGIDKVPLGFNGIVFDFVRDNAIVKGGVVNAFVIRFDVAGKVLADKAIKQ